MFPPLLSTLAKHKRKNLATRIIKLYAFFLLNAIFIMIFHLIPIKYPFKKNPERRAFNPLFLYIYYYV